MKHASILLLTIGLCGLSFAACAEGDDTPFGNRPSGGTGGEGGSIVTSGNGGQGGKPATTSSSSSSSSNGPGVCMATCTTDADCVNACPVPGVGINCCNVPTKNCYVSGEKVCPSQGAGSSGGMYP